MQKRLVIDFARLPEDLAHLVGPGSIYEANALLESLPALRLADGTPVAKAVTYHGYELWWMHYDSLFYHFCLPYTRYKKLLEHARGFAQVHCIDAPYPNLFACYFDAHGVRSSFSRSTVQSPRALPFGVVLQGLLTLMFLPVLMLRRTRIALFTGDKFEKGTDHDFRLRYIYEELRKRDEPFYEIIRGVRGWREVLEHAFVRGRATLYTEPVVFLGRLLGTLFGPRTALLLPEAAGDGQFKLRLATLFIKDAATDIWAIRCLRVLLRAVGVRTVYITAGTERNFSTLLACKLLRIPTVGILHGVASRFYNVYDFMPGFTGGKRLSVDTYGVWSEWWREYYLAHSKAYAPGQLVVSGIMRPLANLPAPALQGPRQGPLKILFVAGELSVPEEILPYLRALMADERFSVHLTFRPYRDAFELWVAKHQPSLLAEIGPDRIFKGRRIQDDIAACDVVVGTYSTAALEALLQQKPVVFYDTKKWGDYFELQDYVSPHTFFATSPSALVDAAAQAVAVPRDELERLRERYFGDPLKNGSAWVVDRLQALSARRG